MDDDLLHLALILLIYQLDKKRIAVSLKGEGLFILENLCDHHGRLKVDLHALMKELAAKQINLVHVEAGAVLCGSLLTQQLVDEIVIYMAPHVMGDAARGLFHLPGLEKMKDRISLRISDVRAIGDDIRITASPQYNECQE